MRLHDTCFKINTKRQGKAVSMQQRETIIHLYNSSFSLSEIARRLCLNKATVFNIINTFINENRLAPKQEEIMYEQQEVKMQ